MNNNDSRTHNSMINIGITFINKFASQILNFLVRTVFIRTLSIEYLGVSGLFTNILSILSLAELGLGGAMIFLLYKPIAENNKEQLKTYMHFNKKVYRIIGSFILIVGLSFTPFLNFIISKESNISNLQLIYILYIVNTASSYFLGSYKQSFFQADQKLYVTCQISLIFQVIGSLIQIIVLLILPNYIIYYSLGMIITAVSNLAISYIANKHYPFLKEKDIKPMSKNDLKNVSEKITAAVMNRISTIVLNSTDNVILSKFIGLAVVGVYSNYLTIIGVLRSFIYVFFDGIAGSIGNLCASTDKKKQYEVFSLTYYFNIWISGFSSISLALLFNHFMTIWTGRDLVLNEPIVLTICVVFYIQTNMRACDNFRSATGLFYDDRYFNVLQCIINLVLSIILVKIIGIAGVFIGTIIALLSTLFWVQPYLVYKKIFEKPVRIYFFKYSIWTIIWVFIYFLLKFIFSFMPMEGIGVFMAKMVLCIIISNGIFGGITYKSSEFKILMGSVKNIFAKVVTS